jgi:hypothetical protein
MSIYIGRLASLRRATIKLVFGLQPIIKLSAWKAAAFEIVAHDYRNRLAQDMLLPMNC